MKRPIICTLAVAGAFILSGFAGRRGAAGPGSAAQAAKGRVPVIVELFTSEGCSSCPPADALLVNLEQAQPVEGAEVIALGEHVDYWNQLGWADRFSSEQFTERQGRYAQAFGLNSVYTPQMVVDGRTEFVGSSRGRAHAAIARALLEPKATMQITAAPKEPSARPGELRLRVRLAELPALSAGDAAEVWLAITEGNLSSDVSRGENSGRLLRHTAVVRRLTALGKLDPQKPLEFRGETSLGLDGGWRRENLRAVAFAQERGSGRVVAAASMKLEE